MASDTQTLTGPSVKPASGKPAKQLVVFLHGVGADGEDLISLAPMFAHALPDAHFVSPNAPQACDMAPYGYQWFSLQDRNPSVMLKGIQETAPLLNKFIDAELKKLGLTDENLMLVGFSQGTMMSLYTALRRPKACAAVVGYSGALLAPELLKSEARSTPPVCLIHGNADMVVAHGSMAVAEAGLKEAGISVETHSRPGLGHGIDPQGISLAREFLERQLSGVALSGSPAKSRGR